MQGSAILCGVVQYSAIYCGVMQYSVELCSAIYCGVKQCSAVRCSTVVYIYICAVYICSRNSCKCWQPYGNAAVEQHNVAIRLPPQ